MNEVNLNRVDSLDENFLEIESIDFFCKIDGIIGVT